MSLALLMAGCTSDNGNGDGDEAKPQAAASSASGQLFVASAAEGTLQPQDAEHEFKLTLGEANDSVGVFTDRPDRKAGTESLADFAAAWEKRGFDKTPPNAAVVWGKDSSARVFELSDSAYDAAADTLTFTARDLGDETSTALSSFKGVPDDELPTDLGEVAVFIDNAEGTSGGLFFVVAPPGGEATITIKDQTLYSSTFNVIQGRGAGKQSSPNELEVVCSGTQKCYLTAGFTLTPGTWPVEGTLEASPGVSVGRGVVGGGATVKVPAGDFSYGEEGK
ncbi:hypothetical protein [Aeromicrobium sp.]|uniref:hypothetical protein n=1 Tax=Aeromicrobium sp. TaxID=1871063 RepID=UPI003C3267B1